MRREAHPSGSLVCSLILSHARASVSTRLWFRDLRFSDTQQRSHQLAPDGGLIYLQGGGQSTATYLRVIPDWVNQMTRAVDRANR